MKKLGITLVAFGAFACAQAGFNLNIDVQYQTVNLPSSGTLTVQFTGTVDVLLPNFDIIGAFVEFPFANATDQLVPSFDAGFVAYINSNSPGVDYAGNLFSVAVPSTAPLGFYYLDFEGGLAEFIVSGTDGTASGGDNEFFGVNVVPEPATMAALGFGALALLRRRRK